MQNNSNQPPIQIQQERNYTSAAWLSAALSFFFLVPGFIAALINLLEADSTRVRTGTAPQGYGCLWAVLISTAMPIITALFIFMFLAVSVLASAH